MQNPAYLVLSEYNIYHFRWPIPVHLLADAKRRYCKLSLGTREPHTALYLGKLLSCGATAFLKRVELRGMDYSELKQIMQTYLQRALTEAKEDMEWRGENKKLMQQFRAIADNTLGLWDELAPEIAPDYLKHVCKVMDAEHIIEQEPEWTWLKQCFYDAYPAFAKALTEQADRSIRKFDFSLSEDAPAKPIKVIEAEPVRLSYVIEKYLAAHVQDGLWDENTYDSKRAILDLLMELLGKDYDISQMDAKAARAVRDDIKRIPRNRNKNPRVCNLPLREAMELEGVERIATVTASKYFNTVRSLFDWCAKEEYIARNPFSSITLGTERKKKKSDRTAFTQEQMKQIRDALNPDGIHYRYWGTLLGIYTGARLNEVSQLMLDDIQQKEGIWYFNMNDDGDDKRLKTDAAKRFVPIHKELLRLGILEEAERLRKQGHSRFLHQLKFCRKNGYGKKLGHYFNQVLLPDLGLKKKAHVEVFHALRHTAVTRLYQAGVPQPIVETIVGHERSGTSQQVYFSEGYKLSQLKEAMDKFDPLAA
ncbi:MAG: hypothetical protein DI582_04450 [Azospirillum brasilense]|nr:MAG: hypothetical protein DI582_04450 [Azospirillum brasilense]